MQPLGKTRSRPCGNRGARQYHSDRTHERRGGLGGSSRKTIGSLVVRSDKTWYHIHPTTRVTLRSWNLGLGAGCSPRPASGKPPRHITRGRSGSERFRSSCRTFPNPITYGSSVNQSKSDLHSFSWPSRLLFLRCRMGCQRSGHKFVSHAEQVPQHIGTDPR
jgi:hypothetical protein